MPFPDAVYDRVGNILMSRVMGAEIELVDEGFDIGIRESWQRALDDVKARGGVPYAIPAGASVHKFGGLGFVGFAEEVRAQEIDPSSSSNALDRAAATLGDRRRRGRACPSAPSGRDNLARPAALSSSRCRAIHAACAALAGPQRHSAAAGCAEADSSQQGRTAHRAWRHPLRAARLQRSLDGLELRLGDNRGNVHDRVLGFRLGRPRLVVVC